MVIIGAGRVGTGLAARAAETAMGCAVICRTDGWAVLEAPAGTPVMVAVRNDDLRAVIARVPTHRRPDLVFVQNGLIGELLREEGLRECTRGLLYFASRSRGGPIEPGVTSWFSGPHAATSAAWMHALNLDAQPVIWPVFMVREFEKFAWIVAHGPLCETFDATVGDIARDHRGPLTEICEELVAVGRAYGGMDVPVAHLVERLTEYSKTIPTYRAVVKEWSWRNGFVLNLAQRYSLSVDVQRTYLSRLGHPESS